MARPRTPARFLLHQPSSEADADHGMRQGNPWLIGFSVPPDKSATRSLREHWYGVIGALFSALRTGHGQAKWGTAKPSRRGSRSGKRAELDYLSWSGRPIDRRRTVDLILCCSTACAIPLSRRMFFVLAVVHFLGHVCAPALYLASARGKIS